LQLNANLQFYSLAASSSFIFFITAGRMTLLLVLSPF